MLISFVFNFREKKYILTEIFGRKLLIGLKIQ